MRITGGKAGRLILKTPKGYDVRPTPDLVKQAVFNSLGTRIEGARVLDLFSGTGALGLECLSRGASLVVSVEKNYRHADYARNNRLQIGLSDANHEFRVQDVFVVLPQLAAASRQFDIVIADPPYGQKNIGCRSVSLAQKLLDDPYLPSLLVPDGLFILGHTKRDTLDFPAPWEEMKMLKHGDSLMRFVRKASLETPPEQ
jgi:16S rRNA (guanine966-N2)-methyltransferase